MLKRLSKAWFYLIILAISLFLLKDLFQPGFPDTHDGHNHLARLANLWLTVRSGQIPPRFAPNLDHGFGYPVFNFNYYLPFFMALFYKLLFSLSLEISLKAAFISFYVLGGWGIFSWLRNKIHPPLALLASLVYLTMPYQLVNIFVRGNTGEVAILGILPWVFWALDKLKPKVNKNTIVVTIIVSIYWLSHNLTTITGLPLILFYHVFTNYKKLGTKSFIRQSLIIFCLSISLTAFFYLPAFFEKKYTILDGIIQNQQLNDHFLYPSQLISSAWGYGYSEPGLNDDMSFSLGLPHFILILLNLIFIIILLFKKKLKTTQLKPYLFFLFFFTLIIFLTLNSSQFIYQLIKPLKYLQFPWRWLTLIPLCLAFLATWGFNQIKPMKALNIVYFILGLILIATALPIAKASNYFHNQQDDFYYKLFITSSTMHENTSKWFVRDSVYDFRPPYVLERTSQAKEIVLKWTAKKHQYQIQSNQPLDIVEHTAYFPGWQTKANGKLVDINYQDSQFPGFISFKLPPGDYQIETIFTQKTPARIIGNSLSLTGLVATIFLWLKLQYKHPYEKKKK